VKGIVSHYTDQDVRVRLEGKEKIGQPKQLILDMPVRWYSTYGMLHRAEVLREVRSNIIIF
jgi:hypothetical protein